MEKTTVYLDGVDYRRLKQIARRKGKTPAELVREAVAEYTVRHGRRRSLPKSVGGFASGRGDASERAEEYLKGFGQD
jgi:hypothetical protein